MWLHIQPLVTTVTVSLSDDQIIFFFISNFRRVLNVLFFLLGDSLTSEFHMPTFRNTIFSIFIDGVSRKNVSYLHRL